MKRFNGRSRILGILVVAYAAWLAFVLVSGSL